MLCKRAVIIILSKITENGQAVLGLREKEKETLTKLILIDVT